MDTVEVLGTATVALSIVGIIEAYCRGFFKKD